ncbi:hypothetical protein NBZ79_12055 [Sneathiella marina]|uniref:Lipoprotein n=1 Tax=Sneathiella marina TaxID=2950108 RepID=A0ABY4VZ89_9PROT|nr:hypothetical protein [Sneathiella marina]USG59909.1 hypothetical protein NBZ79_12055 [Sneathiella marina]
MKPSLALFTLLILGACNTAPKSLAENCAYLAEEYRANTVVITNNRGGNRLQRFDANRLYDLNIAIKNNATSDKCDVSGWPAQPERPV